MYESFRDEIINIRRELHAAPEASGCEYATQAYIMAYLRKCGLEPLPCDNTGVVCFIDMGADDADAVRADMDALPVAEETGLSFASKNSGMMHACGHDAHMAMVLGLAGAVTAEKLIFPRNLLLIFQPAEETTGGAKDIIATGIFEKYRVKNIYGFHMGPDYPKGKIAARAGEFFASSAEFYIEITGLGAHGAQPEKGKDALYAATLICKKLKELLPTGDSLNTGIISPCSLRAGSAVNVIAASASISGITRAFEDKIFEDNIAAVTDTAHEQAHAAGCEAAVRINRTYPAVINNKDLYTRAGQILGSRFTEAQRTFFAEDFAYYTRHLPGLFMFLGTRDENHTAPLHSSRFDFDENVLLEGVRAYIELLK